MRRVRRGRQGLLVVIGRTSCTVMFRRVMSCHEDGELVSKNRGEVGNARRAWMRQ